MDTYILLLTILLAFPLRCRGSPDCDSYTDCETCTSHDSWNDGACRWCPLDRECHAYMSPYNSCTADQNIRSLLGCLTGYKSYGVYNPQLAYSATLLSAIAYSDTPTKCMDTIFPDGGFELLYAFGHSCEDLSLFEYERCYAYIAISKTKKMIVLAYRGTTSTEQISDQIVSVLITPKQSFWTGGEVQYYFKQAYDNLFQCIRSSITELVKQNPEYEVLITGHSLGGALASLTAATLIYAGVVRENKLSLYTFGMPRVGDKDYAFRHDKIVNNSWRVVHGRDIVAHFPTCNLVTSIIGYGCEITASGPCHHRTEIFYKANPMTVSSTYKQCEGNEDDRCSNGFETGDFDDGFDDHKQYFGIPVGTYCDQNGAGGQREHSLMWDKLSSDRCQRIDISKEFTDDNASEADEKNVTSDSVPEARKMRESLLILITFMILKMVNFVNICC